MLDGAREEIAEDFSSWTLLTQLTNRVAYQGYQLVTRLGVQVERQHFAERPTERASMLFLSVNAGLGD